MTPQHLAKNEAIRIYNRLRPDAKLARLTIHIVYDDEPPDSLSARRIKAEWVETDINVVKEFPTMMFAIVPDGGSVSDIPLPTRDELVDDNWLFITRFPVLWFNFLDTLPL